MTMKKLSSEIEYKKKEKKIKKLEEWEKQYRLDHPVYNLNHNGHSSVAGAVVGFISAFPAGLFGYGTTFVTRFALICFVIGYAIDWFCKREWSKAYDEYKKLEDL